MNFSSRFGRFYPNDSEELRERILKLNSLKYYVQRIDQHHLKMGLVNYYPSTGAITIDRVGRHPRDGFEALLALLEKRFPPSTCRSRRTYP